MIVGEKLGDALDATEDYLLVPAPVGITKGFSDSFLGQVVATFPQTTERLEEYGGVRAGCVELIHPTPEDRPGWLPQYTIALAGIHFREANGWNESADLLRTAMDRILREAPSTDMRLATAGIPGSSGRDHNAPMSGVENVLRQHPLEVVVYRRKPVEHRSEAPKATFLAEVPKAFDERYPNSSAAS